MISEDDVSMLVAGRIETEETVRVTYEDPAQNDEKLRLMKLLETQRPQEVWELDSRGGSSVDEESKAGSRKRKASTRKSARLARF